MGAATKRVIAAGGLALLACCTSTADVFPLNNAAKAIGSPQIDFIREGLDQVAGTITMPNGEILKGHYYVARSGGFAAASFSNGQSATALALGSGGVQFVARGAQTEMLCRGSVSIGGHGSGECQTEAGAVWAVD